MVKEGKKVASKVSTIRSFSIDDDLAVFEVRVERLRLCKPIYVTVREKTCIMDFVERFNICNGIYKIETLIWNAWRSSATVVRVSVLECVLRFILPSP